MTNVRVFVYRPLAGEDVFSALVLWDAPAAVSSVEPVVDTYSVIVRRDGVTVSDVSGFVLIRHSASAVYTSYCETHTLSDCIIVLYNFLSSLCMCVVRSTSLLVKTPTTLY